MTESRGKVPFLSTRASLFFPLADRSFIAFVCVLDGTEVG